VEELLKFIKAAKAQGAQDPFIATLLRQNGWSERRVYAAFTAYYEGVTEMAVPARGGRIESSRDAFLYLITYGALATWTCALVLLTYALVDFYWPNTLDRVSAAALRSSVSGELASIIIAFPLFLLLTRSILTDLAKRPESREAEVRHSLTYLALAVAFIFLLGDAIFFLQQFLSGDLTARFIVKALVLSLVAGGVFLYYLKSLVPIKRPAWDRSFGWLAACCVLLALILGFTGIGSPTQERQLAADDQRVSNLDTIQTELADQFSIRKHLPRNLSHLTPDVTHDPTTQKPYRYEPGKGRSYRICATFETANAPTLEMPVGNIMPERSVLCGTQDSSKTRASPPPASFRV